MAFYEGQPINGFAGLKSPEEIKSFFDEVVSASSVSADLMEDLNKKLETAELFLEKKEVERAMEIFSELIASELPKKEMSRSMSGLGKCLLELNRLEELDELLNQLEEDLKSSNDIKDLIRQLMKKNIGVLITDHNVREVLDICDYSYVMHAGEIIADGESDRILGNKEVRKFYLGDSFKY